MKYNPTRRSFLKRSAAAATLAVPLVRSLEEYALAAQESAPPKAATAPGAAMPTGVIGKVRMSRLLCGGNLISGYAHSRDLMYVSPLLNHYFTDEKILETWAISEQHGINTMILNPSDTRASALYRSTGPAAGASNTSPSSARQKTTSRRR